MSKIPSTVLMIRPVNFAYNKQTAESKSFQTKKNEQLSDEIQQLALKEFNTFVKTLSENYIDVIIFDDTKIPYTPDSIFPNNWISFHENNTIVLYSMLAENRRKERRDDIINYFKNEKTELIDLSENETKNIFLEGTGSILFDYKNKIAYSAISSRTNKKLFEELCSRLHFKSICFKAVDRNEQAIYHTNVLMSIGDTFAVICKDCISDKKELEAIVSSLITTDHAIIEISFDQMNAFAGNMYQLFNFDESLIVMSEQAFNSLNTDQINALEKHGRLIYSPLYTIEKYGGGSARCMIADVKL